MESNPQHLEQALDRISEIHALVSKGELFRGYRALPVAFSGLLALAAAALQPSAAPLLPTRLAVSAGTAFVAYWILVAALVGAASAAGLLYYYWILESPSRRRHTSAAVQQYLPCVVAGALVTGGLAFGETGAWTSLPGIWAVLAGLGLFSSRTHLPRAIGFAGLYYLLAGGVLLTRSVQGAAPSPWDMGMVFGIGQLGSAFVLYWNLERNGGR